MGGRVMVHVHNLELGGSQINAVEFADGVREFGYDAVVFGPDDMRPDGPSLVDVAEKRGVPLRTLPRQSTVARDARQLARAADDMGADLVHFYGTWSFRPAYWGPCRFGKRPLVMTIYEMSVPELTYREPPLIVGAGYLVDELRDRRGPVHLISPPVDFGSMDERTERVDAFLREFLLDPSHLRIVIVSRLDGHPLRPIKSTGVDWTIRAIEGLNRGDIDLVVVGDGNEADRLRNLGQQVNHRLGREAVIFTGSLADPRPAYECADIVIGMGGSAARGIAFGKPLIVAGEFGEFIAFRPENAHQVFRTSFWSERHVAEPLGPLIDELGSLVESAPLRAELGTFGAQFARSEFGLRELSRRLAAIYDSAQQGYGPSQWLFDQRLESRWAAGWLARRAAPRSRIALDWQWS
jgi:glycosyltransferase involved in cell wall biosynthesis